MYNETQEHEFIVPATGHTVCRAGTVNSSSRVSLYIEYILLSILNLKFPAFSDEVPGEIILACRTASVRESLAINGVQVVENYSTNIWPL
jgi:hypothetical protein